VGNWSQLRDRERLTRSLGAGRRLAIRGLGHVESDEPRSSDVASTM